MKKKTEFWIRCLPLGNSQFFEQRIDRKRFL